MSDLYQSPAEVVQETNRRTKGGTHVGADWFTDRVREGTKFNPNTQEFERTGWAYWGDVFGMTTPEGRAAIEEGITKKADAEKIERVLEANPGLTNAQLEAQLQPGQKLTGKNVKGVVAEAIRDRSEELSPAEKATIRYQDNTLAATIAQNNSTNQRLLQQGAQAHQLALINAADARDANAATLALQRDQMIREDRRYNEQQERLDRRDRKQGMQSLVAGLAALGAAFAL